MFIISLLQKFFFWEMFYKLYTQITLFWLDGKDNNNYITLSDIKGAEGLEQVFAKLLN